MPEEVEQELDDRRGDIAAAFRELDGVATSHADEDATGGTHQSSPAGENPVSPDTDGEAPPSTGSRPRDENGRFLKQDAKPAESDKPQPSSPAAKPGPAGQGAAASATVPTAAPAAPPASPDVPAQAVKAPAAWRPLARSKWDSLPPEVQQEALRVDHEFRTVQAKASKEAQFAEEMRETFRPYEAQIRAAGTNPQQYVGSLLQTAHALAYGNPQQQAEVLSNIVIQYGRHLLQQDAQGNSLLDQMLVAKMNGARSQPQQPQQFKDPRVDQLLQTLQQREAAAAEDRAARFAGSPGHEHFDDVADEMSALVTFWRNQGTEITDAVLEKAYRIACQNNEEVAKVIAQKEAAKSAATAQAATQRARNAGSSVQSRPATPSPRPATGDDRRADIMESLAQLQGR